MVTMITPTRQTVKYVVRLALAQVGVRTRYELARQLGVTGPAISMVLSGERRIPRLQAAIAEIAGRPPYELFGELTHPSLCMGGARGAIDDAARIRALLRGQAITAAGLARKAGMPASTVRAILAGRRRSAWGQLKILEAFQSLAGSEIGLIQFWGHLLAEVIG
jgi:transcriptional regulator with XRE-family HTH domain